MDTRAAPLKHFYLVDGSGFIFRAFHALPPMTRPDGTPVNAVYGFTNMLLKLIDEMEADHLAVIFDAARTSFRNDIFPDYKAQRPDPPDELAPQFPLIREAVEALNVPCIEMPGYEADDIIATYARMAAEAGATVTIVSSDKDLMQLVTDRVKMLDAMKNRLIGPDEVVEKFGVGPDKIVELQALTGDPIDNVPGVPGIGVKTAAQLLLEYGDLDTLLARAGEIKQPKRRENLLANIETVRVSRELVKLKDDVAVERPLEDLAVVEPRPEALLAFLKEQGFRSLTARVEARLGLSGEPAPTAPPAETVYELVQDEAALRRWVEEAVREGVVALAVHADSTQAMRARLIGLSLAVKPGRACYLPLGHAAPAAQGALDLAGGADAAAPQQIPYDRAFAILRPMLEDPAVLKVGHDVKYIVVVLARLGLTVTPVDDVMVLSFVLDGGQHGHGMEDLARLYLDHEGTKLKDLTGSGRKQVGLDALPPEAVRDYAAEVADITLRLHGLHKPRLVTEHMVTVYETIERPLIPVLAAMERRGILVDPAVLRGLSRDLAQRMAALEDEIKELAGGDFNIGSPKQLGEILFDRMGLPGARKTKTGAYVTDADVLEGLAAAGHDLPARVLDWRQLSKLKSTYTDALVECINPDTQRVHTCFAMAAAQTGRLSSVDPNLQNIPIRTEEGRKIRRAFVAKEGCRLVSLDYSQIELRILAHMAGIDALRRAFGNGGDIHALTASQVFGIPVAGMDPMIRRKAKAINFGIIYGISPFGLARQLGVDQAEARAYIDTYFQTYPGIRDYMDGMREECRKKGLVRTLFGRKIHLPGINDKNPMRRNYAERQAINAPIQGTAADIIKRAMIRVPAALARAGLKAEMLLQVHDELVFEAAEAEVEKTIAVVRETMETAAAPAVTLDVPLAVEAGAGSNWDEAH